jgi:hypothetical protein
MHRNSYQCKGFTNYPCSSPHFENCAHIVHIMVAGERIVFRARQQIDLMQGWVTIKQAGALASGTGNVWRADNRSWPCLPLGLGPRRRLVSGIAPKDILTRVVPARLWPICQSLVPDSPLACTRSTSRVVTVPIQCLWITVERLFRSPIVR